MRRLENQPCLNFKMEARLTQGSAKHQFLSGTLHWFAIRDNVSISPITAEQPVGQQSGCWACAHRAWQRFHALIAAVQLRVGLALGHTISTVIDWQGSAWGEAAGRSQPHRPRGAGWTSPMFSLTFRADGMLQTLAFKRQFVCVSASRAGKQDGRRNMTGVLQPQPWYRLSAASFDPAYYRSLTVEEKKKSRQHTAEQGGGRWNWDREPNPDEIYINYSTIMRAL